MDGVRTLLGGRWTGRRVALWLTALLPVASLLRDLRQAPTIPVPPPIKKDSPVRIAPPPVSLPPMVFIGSDRGTRVYSRRWNEFHDISLSGTLDDGIVWLATEAGVREVIRASEGIARDRHYTMADGLPAARILAITGDSQHADGDAWCIATGPESSSSTAKTITYFLCHLDRRAERWSVVRRVTVSTGAGKQRAVELPAVVATPGYVCFSFGGAPVRSVGKGVYQTESPLLLLYDRHSQKWGDIDRIPWFTPEVASDLSSPPRLSVYALAAGGGDGSEDSVWLGTSQGLVKRDLRRGTWQHLLPDRAVIALDRDRTAWTSKLFALSWDRRDPNLKGVRPRLKSGAMSGPGLFVEQVPSHSGLPVEWPVDCSPPDGVLGALGSGNRVLGFTTASDGRVWVAMGTTLTALDPSNGTASSETYAPLPQLVGEHTGVSPGSLAAEAPDSLYLSILCRRTDPARSGRPTNAPFPGAESVTNKLMAGPTASEAEQVVAAPAPTSHWRDSRSGEEWLLQGNGFSSLLVHRKGREGESILMPLTTPSPADVILEYSDLAVTRDAVWVVANVQPNVAGGVRTETPYRYDKQTRAWQRCELPGDVHGALNIVQMIPEHEDLWLRTNARTYRYNATFHSWLNPDAEIATALVAADGASVAGQVTQIHMLHAQQANGTNDDTRWDGSWIWAVVAAKDPEGQQPQERRLACWDTANRVWNILPPLPPMSDGQRPRLRDVLPEKAGIWAATSQGAYRFHPENNRWERLKLPSVGIGANDAAYNRVVRRGGDLYFVGISDVVRWHG